MNKKFLFRFLIAAGVLAAAVLWLLAILNVIPEFNWTWTVVVLAGTWGIAFLISGMFGKSDVVTKKWSFLAGGALAAVAVIALILALAVTDLNVQLIIAICATALAAAILLGVLFTGGKKWDSADNQNVGYKTYRERKKEEEENKNKDK